MAVEPENYQLSDLQSFYDKTLVVSIKRARNGSWQIVLDIEIEVLLPDGRKVKALQEVSLRGRGTPKPHPYPDWLNKGKQKRAAIRKSRQAAAKVQENG